MSWKILQSLELFRSGLFRLREDRCQLADGREMPRYFVLEFPDWVNVLPVLPNGDLVLVRQYRHASGREHLEIPGGSLDPRRQESPEQGARREMLEETGYDSSKIVKLSSQYPNPALQNNQMHTYVALDVQKVQDLQLDEFEELHVEICSRDKVRDYLKRGEIDHSLMIASLSLALDYLSQHKNG